MAETKYVSIKSKEGALMPNMVPSTSTIVPHPTPCYPPPSLSATHKLRKGRPFIYLRITPPPYTRSVDRLINFFSLIQLITTDTSPTP